MRHDLNQEQILKLLEEKRTDCKDLDALVVYLLRYIDRLHRQINIFMKEKESATSYSFVWEPEKKKRQKGVSKMQTTVGRKNDKA